MRDEKYDDDVGDPLAGRRLGRSHLTFFWHLGSQMGRFGWGEGRLIAGLATSLSWEQLGAEKATSDRKDRQRLLR